ncbi:hypothetical protein JZ785_07635 [Alicyclobacillus curvatus]|nr:hypothetical protein JZ785_07635 [Alicyclobacillus curvatus]
MVISLRKRTVVQVPIKRVLMLVTIVGVAGITGKLLVTSPGTIRLIIATALVVFLLGLSVRKPTMTMYFLMLYLPALGFIRRWLIPVAGWGTFDPLVIVAPIVICIIGSYWLYNRFVKREFPLPETKLFHLVRILLLVDVLEVVNPHQGGLFAGIGGVMFYVVPLFWMVLSKQHLTERWMKVALWTVAVVGVLSALYGLKQTFYGFYPFEQTWIQLSGYAALIVGKHSRAFSTFTSAAEYAQYLVIAIAVLWAVLLKGNMLAKICAAPALGLVAYALFLESSRSPIVTGMLGIAVMSIAVVKKVSTRITVALLAVIGIVGLYIALGHMASSSNALVSHQVSGLTHPFNKKDSTASMHVSMLFSGLKRAVTNPIGSGLGATTLAAGKLGSGSGAANSEIDLGNMCISDGLIGGITYLLIMARVIVLAIALNRQKQFVPVAILGVLIVTLGQWSNGGDYSTCAFVWLCIGYLDKATQTLPLNQRALSKHGFLRAFRLGGET